MLRTKRLVIKSIENEDREEMISLFTNDIVKQTYMIPDLLSEEALERMFQRYQEISNNTSRYVRGVYLQGKLIGIVNDVEITEGSIELGYAFLPAFYNQGYATEMLEAVLADLKEKGYKQIRAGAFSENRASIRVMEKCGMKRLDITEQIEYRGVVHDCVYYGANMMSCNAKLRNKVAEIIGVTVPDTTPAVEYKILETTQEEGYTRQLIEYDSCGDKVSAFLLLPEILENNPAILIHHQHNREHHLGKSEVCGLAGNPLQAFGPELAKRGFVVLAPDSICFEERRKDPSVEGFDFWQHFNEVCYRIICGECLMKKVLEDAMNGIALLSNLPFVDKKRIGTLGHSYGGNTVLFLSALDERISFSCASGSACTYEYRMMHDVGIEMASVIPGFHGQYDIYDLVSCIAPRKLLIVSADEDKYSMDAPYIVERAERAYMEQDALQNLCHKRYSGGHGLTQERFDYIVEWINLSANYERM